MKRRSGIFMLEAMVSLVLLALGATVVSQTFPASGNLERTSREAFVASLRVRMKLFELQRLGAAVGTREGVFEDSSDRWKLTVTGGPIAGTGVARLEILKDNGELMAGGRVETLVRLRDEP